MRAGSAVDQTEDRDRPTLPFKKRPFAAADDTTADTADTCGPPKVIALQQTHAAVAADVTPQDEASPKEVPQPA